MSDANGDRSAPGMDHTLEDYRAFLEGLLNDGYTFQGFGPLEERAVLVRHDVDLSPKRALEMAKCEAELGATTTYCFMLTTPAYNILQHVDTLEEIRSLGHDLALHFDTHHYWEHRPGRETLESTVRSERETLERLVRTSIETVSFHMPPEWVLDETFIGFENAYQPRFFSEIDYISDSKGKWRTRTPFVGERPDQVQILVHPGLWTPGDHRMSHLLDELERHCKERIDRYVEAY